MLLPDFADFADELDERYERDEGTEFDERDEPDKTGTCAGRSLIDLEPTGWPLPLAADALASDDGAAVTIMPLVDPLDATGCTLLSLIFVDPLRAMTMPRLPP